ncbi:MAG: hypothetical protein ACYDCL_03710, partial [Myxococcales bacterium]
MIDAVDLSHGEGIGSEAQAALGAFVVGDGNGAKIALPMQLCSGSLCRVELSAGGSLCVSSGLLRNSLGGKGIGDDAETKRGGAASEVGDGADAEALRVAGLAL